MKRIFWLIALVHIGYWLPRLLNLYIFAQNGGGADHDAYALYTGITTPIEVIVFYCFYFYLVPVFLQRRQISKFIIYGAGLILMSAGLSVPATMLVQHIYNSHHPGRDVFITSTTLSLVNVAIAACMIKGFFTWLTEIRYKEQLERQNLETNMALLKAQINPHFLFNTLNNIDVLIEKDAATASMYLKKLSDILRFTLYESPAESIPLRQEAGYIEQYIELQKIRTANPDFVKLELKGNLDSVPVAPMLFIPFIENAFKHCTNKKIGNAIAIKINADAKTITFECSNAYDDTPSAMPEKSGLGLELMKSRLKLLYHDNYQLNINKTKDRFTVNLTITLAA